MNETIYPDNASDLPWPNADQHARVPDTSMLPSSEKAPLAPAELVKNAPKGVHSTVDRVADSAAPAVRQVGEKVAAAAETLQAKTDELREKGGEWAESVRSTVRSNPLGAVAAAATLGAVIARITR